MLSPLAVFSYPLRHGVNSVLTHKKYLHALLKSPRAAEHSQRGTAPSQAPIPLCFSDTSYVSAPRPSPTKTYEMSLCQAFWQYVFNIYRENYTDQTISLIK